MKRPFSRGWINKPSPNGADKKPAWEAVTRRVTKAAADGQGHVQSHRLALSSLEALLASPFVTISRKQALLWSWGQSLCPPTPQRSDCAEHADRVGVMKAGQVGQSKPTPYVFRQVPSRLPRCRGSEKIKGHPCWKLHIYIYIYITLRQRWLVKNSHSQKKHTHTLNNFKDLKPNHIFWLNKIVLSPSLFAYDSARLQWRLVKEWHLVTVVLFSGSDTPPPPRAGGRGSDTDFHLPLSRPPSGFLNRVLYLQLFLHLCLGGLHDTQIEGEGEREHIDWGRPR